MRLFVPSKDYSDFATGFDIVADGKKDLTASDDNRVRSVEGVTKESLAEKPLKVVLKDSQKYLSIGYDMAKQHMTLMQEGVDVELLPPVPECDLICHSKVDDERSTDKR